MGIELRQWKVEAFPIFDQDPDLEVALLSSTGQAFCAGEEMKKSLERGNPGGGVQLEAPFMTSTLQNLWFLPYSVLLWVVDYHKGCINTMLKQNGDFLADTTMAIWRAALII